MPKRNSDARRVALTRAQRRTRFLRQYLGGGPGVAGVAGAAALKAGLTRSPGSAYLIGHHMLRDPEVVRRIAAHLERVEAGTDRIVAELARLAFSDLRDLVTWDARGRVTVRASDVLPDGAAAALQEIEQTETAPEDGPIRRRLRVRLHGKLEALTLLARVRKLLIEREGPPPGQAVLVQFYLPANARVPEGAPPAALRVPARRAIGDGKGESLR